MKKLLFMLAVMSYVVTINAQITTKEKPISFTMSMARSTPSELDVKTMPTLDLAKLAAEDVVSDSCGLPPRYGFPHEVSFNMTNSGTWITLPEGDRLWRLAILCPDGKSVDVVYDKFWIPEGGKFFVYDSEKQYTIGAVTHDLIYSKDRNNPDGFATGLIPRNKIVLEYYQPKDAEQEAIISIARIIHGYRTLGISVGDNLKSEVTTTTTHININCTDGIAWQEHKDAIGLIANGYGAVCTGALIRTTEDGYAPIFLTADHCLPDNIDAISNPNLYAYIFYWHYEDPACEDKYRDYQYVFFPSTSGAILLANDKSTDFALLRLKQDPMDHLDVNPYYLGWNRSSTVSTTGTGIHHPAGLTKKMTLYKNIASYGKNIFWFDAPTSASNTHWKAEYIRGYTIGGSSGSPLLDANNRVIGQLHGGLDPAMYYGRFDISWDGYGSNQNNVKRSLKSHLDPIKNNPSFLNGGRPPLSFSVDKQIICSDQLLTTKVLKGYTNDLNIVWSSSQMIKVSQSGKVAVFKAKEGYKGNASITASNGGQVVTRSDIWVGAPQFKEAQDTIIHNLSNREKVEINISLKGGGRYFALEYASGSDEYTKDESYFTYTIIPTLSPNKEGEIVLKAVAENDCGVAIQYHKIKLNKIPPKDQVKLEGPEQCIFYEMPMHKYKMKGIDSYREIFPNAKIEWSSSSTSYPLAQIIGNGDEAIFFPDIPEPTIVTGKIKNEGGDVESIILLQKGLDFAPYPYVEMVDWPHNQKYIKDTIYVEDNNSIKVRVRGLQPFFDLGQTTHAGTIIWAPQNYGYFTDEKIEENSIWGSWHTAVFHPTEEVTDGRVGVVFKSAGHSNMWEYFSKTFDIVLRNQPVVSVTIIQNFYPYSTLYIYDFSSPYLENYDFYKLLTDLLCAPNGEYIEEWTYKNGTKTRNIKQYYNANNRSLEVPIVVQLPSFSVKVYSLYSTRPLYEAEDITSFNINDTYLPKGVYIIEKIDAEGKRTTEKVMKSKY